MRKNLFLDKKMLVGSADIINLFIFQKVEFFIFSKLRKLILFIFLVVHNQEIFFFDQQYRTNNIKIR